MSFPTLEEVIDKIDDLCTPYTENSGNVPIGFAVGVLWPEASHLGCTVIREAWKCPGSLVDQSGKSITLGPETPFKIASMSKTFVASLFASAIMIQQKLTPASTVEQAFTGQITDAVINAISLWKLANYSSGLPRDFVPPNQHYPFSFQDMYDYINAHGNQIVITSLKKCGRLYSNFGFALLGAAVNTALKAAPGDDLDQLVECILQPLGMSQTHEYTSQDNTTLPRGFVNPGKTATGGAGNEPAYEGGGGLISTLHDMLRFLRFNLGLLPGELRKIRGLLQAQSTPGCSGCTLAWFTTQHNWAPAPVFAKNGGLPGFGSWMGFVPFGPSLSAAVVVLGNLQHPAAGKTGSVTTDIGKNLLAWIYGGTWPDTVPDEDSGSEG